MFDTETVRLLMQAAIEAERHGQPAVDTMMELSTRMCCQDCIQELISEAAQMAV